MNDEMNSIIRQKLADGTYDRCRTTFTGFAESVRAMREHYRELSTDELRLGLAQQWVFAEAVEVFQSIAAELAHRLTDAEGLAAPDPHTRRAFTDAVRALLPQATIEWPDSDDPFKAVVTVRLPHRASAAS